MPGKPKLVGVRGYTPLNSAPPSEKDFEFIYSTDPQANASLALSQPPHPPKKGVLSKILPWIFK